MKEIGKIIRFQNTHQSEDFQATNVEDFKDVPFHIRRTYWTYDIPEGQPVEVTPTGNAWK